MGLSSGGKTTSGSAQKWAQPYAKAAAGTATDIFNANQAGLGQITNTVQSLLPGLVNKYNAGNPTMNAASGYAQDVLGGKYLGAGNPYLNAMIDATDRSVTNKVGAAAGSLGAWGGSDWQSNLTRNLADAENQLRYGDYSQERANQQAAMSAAPSMAAADYLAINPLLQTAQLGAQLPYTGLEAYTNSLGTLFNGSKQTAPGLGRMVLGGIASGIGQGASAMAGGA